MPAPGPGGTQSSLAGMVAWLTKPFRQAKGGRRPSDEFSASRAANPTIWLPAQSDAIEFLCRAPR